MQDAFRATSEGLAAFIDASPTPYHAAENCAQALLEAGFERLDELEEWPSRPGRFFSVRGGGFVAMAMEGDFLPSVGLSVVGAHTDSPNLRIKPQPDTSKAKVRQLGVEVYGGVLLNSWLDRDLGLAGRAAVRNSDGSLRTELFCAQRPLLRVPQLAIHLDRDIYSKGLQLDKQRHMSPIWGVGANEQSGFQNFLAEELGVSPADIVSWDAMCHDLTPSSLLGRREEFLAAPRLDNLASCYAGLQALLRRLDRSQKGKAGQPRRIPALAFFDHEEVGSNSSGGAQGPILKDLLERSVLMRGGGRQDVMRCQADSVCISADMAHATHPNYTERHEPDHWVELNAGPVIKLNSNMRYATNAETAAQFQLACERAEVPFQKFVNRTDLACGSTIGPITAANLGIDVVDVGGPQLSMHSAREMCGSLDTEYMIRAMDSFWD